MSSRHTNSNALNAWFCVDVANLPFIARSLKKGSIFASAGCISSRERIPWNWMRRRIHSQQLRSVRLLHCQLSTLNHQLLGASSLPGGLRCVSCQSPIDLGVRICPQCGWTQPEYETFRCTGPGGSSRFRLISMATALAAARGQ